MARVFHAFSTTECERCRVPCTGLAIDELAFRNGGAASLRIERTLLLLCGCGTVVTNADGDVIREVKSHPRRRFNP